MHIYIIVILLLVPSLAHAVPDRIIGTEAGTGIMEEMTPEDASALIGGGTDLPTDTITTSESAPLKIRGTGGQSTNGINIYQHSGGTLYWVCVVANVENDCNYIRKLASGKSWGLTNSSDVGILTITEAGTLTINATVIKTSLPFLVPLNPRGAATSNLESIVTNQPGDYYLTVTDANTDAADFSFPVTVEMAGKTLATFRLIGASKNAAPSGNIDFDCALSSYTPGTDTFAAHVTTGEVTALLTPATQYRPVAVTTSSHTMNGGALVAGDVVHGSCEVDATATTSAQMTDFRLWGWVLITLN